MNITKKVTKAFVAVFVMISMFPMMNLVINAEDNAQTRGAAGGDYVARIGTKDYETLNLAVDAANDGDVITILKSGDIGGVIVAEGKNFTIDFKGNTLNLVDSLVGSSGTETNSFQLLKDSTLVFKNGTIKAKSAKTKILIQNYCNLTLDNMTLDARDVNSVGYALSNNYGNILVKGNTNIHAASGKQAFDLWYGMSTTYDNGVYVTFDETFTGTVNGDIEYGADKRFANDPTWINKAKLTIHGGTFNSNFKDANVDDKTKIEDANIVITKGTFTSDVANYVKDGYKAYLVNGKYVVAPKTTGITLSSSALRVEKSKTAQLTATLAPAGTLEKAIWTTDNNKVATVDATGKVTGVDAGTATITATADGKTASCTVTVYEIKAPVIPPVDKDTNVSLGEEAKEVLKDVVKDVIENVKTSTSISNETREKLETALAAGKDISVAPKVEVKKESAIEKEVVTKIENAMKATTEKDKVAEVAQYYDLSMMLTAAGEPLGTVNELTGKVEFTVSIPKDLTKAGRKFYMVRVHGNGDTERIEGKLDGTDFSFETDKFSIFALVYEDNKVETPTTPAKPTTPTTPEKPGVDTGDVTNAGMLMTMLLAAGFVGFTTLKRRNRI